jgi:hypothetical protein
MNSRHNFTGRLFLIVAFVCTISIATGLGQTHSAGGGGRLIVYRAAGFGSKLGLQLKIDGRIVASIVQGRNYDGLIPTGRHELTVLPVPRKGFRDSTSIWVDVRPGQTYAFTAVWESDQVVLRRSRLSNGAR